MKNNRLQCIDYKGCRNFCCKTIEGDLKVDHTPRTLSISVLSATWYTIQLAIVKHTYTYTLESCYFQPALYIGQVLSDYIFWSTVILYFSEPMMGFSALLIGDLFCFVF